MTTIQLFDCMYFEKCSWELFHDSYKIFKNYQKRLELLQSIFQVSDKVRENFLKLHEKIL